MPTYTLAEAKAQLSRLISMVEAEALMTSDGEPLVVSTWSEVELLSALGVKFRAGQITEPEAHLAVDVYTQLVQPSLRRILVGDADLRRATILLMGWRTALRAGDGLHLAIAEASRATIFTFDRGMAKAGTILGVAVQLVQF